MKNAKKIVILLIFLHAFADASDADPIQSFEKLIASATAKTISARDVYFNNIKKLWAKRQFRVSETKYDVRKSSSMVTPIIGVVSFHLEVLQTELVPTETEAKKLNKFLSDEYTPSFDINLRYSLISARWVFLDGEEVTLWPNSKAPPASISFTQRSIDKEPDSIPFAAIKFWTIESPSKKKEHAKDSDPWI